MAAATTYNPDPADQARAFRAAGFQWIHVVDLDGAFAGGSVNGAAVDAILAAVDIPVQLGGGIRDMAAVEGWLDRGVARIILGTAAVKTPELVHKACKAFPGRIAVGIDARGGRVAVEGWADTSDIDAVELARSYAEAGVAAIIYTDIDRDGALAGPNVAATAALARAVRIPIIASGGVASLADLAALKALEADGVAGVISGRALYDGRIDPAAALRLLAEAA
jgi:phosphoribosylformimino-5-aminoimidazole carboxamide ribotide isomerase